MLGRAQVALRKMIEAGLDGYDAPYVALQELD